MYSAEQQALFRLDQIDFVSSWTYMKAEEDEGLRVTVMVANTKSLLLKVVQNVGN